MDLIINFYKELDTINLIIFWGIIIVILLLLIFAILIVNKNKRLKKIILTKDQEIEESRNELAIKDEQILNAEKRLINTQIYKSKLEKVEKKEIPTNKNEQIINIEKAMVNTQANRNIIEKERIERQEFPTIKEEEKRQETPIIIVEENNNETSKEIKNPEIKEEIFIAEEHVKQNSTNNTETVIANSQKIEVNDNVKNNNNQTKNIVIPSAPYQRNVLREMSLNQTSPIGIIKKEDVKKEEIKKAEELNASLKEQKDNSQSIRRDNYENNYQKEMDSSKEKIVKLYENRNETKLKEEPPIKEKKEYLEEVSKKLEEASEPLEVKRTEYEIKQEEEAIISYEELMKKKDSLEMIDEEEAVISIEELIKKEKEKEKLYNITKEEEDNTFISELKHFRSDL